MAADAVELLMVEHLQCKSFRKLQEVAPDFDRFVSFHEFLLNVHIEVEEKVVFPALYEPLWDDTDEYRATINLISADHKLLDKLARNLMRWKESGNEELYKERMPLYTRLLIEHNEKEESDIFGRWKQLDTGVYISASKEIENVVYSFGIENYRKAMNLSESAFNYLFRSYR